MNEMIAGSSAPTHSPVRLGKRVFWTALLLVAALAGFLAIRAWSSASAARPAMITAGELQERYGIRVNLLGVTAAGGMLDLRLKMVDGQKAAQLLDEAGNFPVLVSQNGDVLHAATDTKVLRGVLVDGGNLFLIFPNKDSVISAGMPVTIRFGELLVGPIVAR